MRTDTASNAHGYAITFLQEKHKQYRVARFRCCECPGSLDIKLGSGANPPEHITKDAEKAGWKYKGKFSRWYCLKCQITMQELRKAEPAVNKPPAEKKVDPNHINPTGREWHDVLTWLEVCYKRDECRYASGFDDTTVAKETRCGLEVVAFIRESEYGEIAADPALTEMKSQIEFLQDKVNELILRTDEQAQLIKILRNQVHRADPAGLNEVRAVVDKADLPAMQDAIKVLRAQIGRHDVSRLDGLLGELRVIIEGIDIDAVRYEIAALKAQMDGRGLPMIEADLTRLREQVANLNGVSIPLLDMENPDGLCATLEEMGRRSTEGVAYLPKASLSLGKV